MGDENIVFGVTPCGGGVWESVIIVHTFDELYCERIVWQILGAHLWVNCLSCKVYIDGV